MSTMNDMSTDTIFVLLLLHTCNIYEQYPDVSIVWIFLMFYQVTCFEPLDVNRPVITVLLHDYLHLW